ncbi:MAG: response regulator [Acidobacteria bacterium]|nr:MAG: response regulator [Acidobacteriota bacterium]
MKQTILLVEDEKVVRSLMCEVLEKQGYEVLACAEPKKAIEVSMRHPGRIDLLLTDVIMPGMNGRQMANRILEMMPGLRVVFMSGYTENVLLDEGLIDSQFEYLQKPFALKTLMQKLVHVLGPPQKTVQ